MSKIPKQPEKKLKLKGKYQSDEKFAFRSVVLSAILGCIFFTISLLFNAEIITILMNKEIIWTIFDVFIKVFAVLLFFLFITTSYGNYKELIGKRLNWRELVLLILFSIGQTILNLLVFILTLIGLIVVLIYLFLVQEL
ncbi:MAG: hypothetical protein ACFE8C_01355 [Promethearchaeota archaeon]